jgi:hypothetical protein
MKILNIQYNYKNKALSWIIYLFNLIFIISGVYFLPLAFETNDDAMMMLLASGQYTGSPEAFLVFINVIYGALLSVFYKLIPGVSWYAVFFLVLQYLSLNVLAKTLIKQNYNVVAKLNFLVFLYIIAVNNIVSLQFTTTSAITALAGLVLINSKGNLKFIGALLFIIASLIRFEAAVLVLIIFSPLFYLEIWQFLKRIYKGKKVNLRKYTLLALVFTFFTAIIFQLLNNTITANNNTFASYYNYNAVRGKIHDNPIALKMNSNFPAGVSEQDYKIFNESILDLNIFNLDKITKIKNSFKGVSIADKFKTGIINLTNHYTKFLVCIVCLILIIIQLNYARVRNLIIALSLIMFLVTCLLISLNGIYKYRVFITALLPLIFVVEQNFNYYSTKNYFLRTLLYALVIAFCFSFFPTKIALALLIIIASYFAVTKFKMPQIHYVLITFSLLFMVFLLDRMAWEKNNSKVKKMEFQKQQALIQSFSKISHKAVFPLPKKFYIDAINPLMVSPELDIKNIIFSGWLASYPNNNHTLKNFDQLLQQSNIMIYNTDNNIVRDIQEIVKNHYHKKYNAQIVLNNNDCCIIEFELID